jgi:hypothetical protein
VDEYRLGDDATARGLPAPARERDETDVVELHRCETRRVLFFGNQGARGRSTGRIGSQAQEMTG